MKEIIDVITDEYLENDTDIVEETVKLIDVKKIKIHEGYRTITAIDFEFDTGKKIITRRVKKHAGLIPDFVDKIFVDILTEGLPIKLTIPNFKLFVGREYQAYIINKRFIRLVDEVSEVSHAD